MECIHRNGDITSYSVEYEDIEGPAQLYLHVSNSRVNISELHVSTNYSIRVAAVNMAGVGVYSSPLVATTDGRNDYIDPQIESGIYTKHSLIPRLLPFKQKYLEMNFLHTHIANRTCIYIIRHLLSQILFLFLPLHLLLLWIFQYT